MKKAKVLTASVIIVSSLSMASAPLSVMAANNAPTSISATSTQKTGMKQFAGASLKKFMISAKSYIEIKDVYFLYGSKEKKAFFTLSVYNGDNTSLDFMDYWVELLSTTGAKFPIQALASEKKSGIVAPKTTRDFVFSSLVDSNVNYNNLSFKIVKWDFSLPNYTKTIGQINVTSKYINSVPSNTFYIDSNKIKSSLGTGNKFSLGGTNQIEVDVNLENISQYEFELLDYQYYIRTRSGLVLRLAIEGLENKKLLPYEKKAITLRTLLKSNIDLNGAQILVTSLEGESKLEVPKGIYNISWNSKDTLTVNQDKKASLDIQGINAESRIVNVYTDQSGNQNGVQLTLGWLNKGNEAIVLPKYKFEIMDSKGVRYPVTLPEAEGTHQLVPNVETEINLQATLPSDVTKGLKLLIKKPKDEANPLEYVTGSFLLNQIQALEGVTSKIYKSVKGSYEIKVSQVERLPWGNQDLVNLFIEVKNNGKASQVIPELSGLLRINGILINEDKVNIIRLDQSGIIKPGESTKFVATTKIPYTYDTSDVSLNLSDKVSESSKQTIGLFKTTDIKEIPIVGPLDSYKIETIGRRSSLDLLHTYTFKGNDNDLIYSEFKYTNHEKRYSKLPVLKAFLKTKEGEYLEAKADIIKSSVKQDGSAILTIKSEVPKTLINNGDLQLVVGTAMNGKDYSTDEVSDGFIGAQAFKLPKSQDNVQSDLFNLAIEPYQFTLNRLITMLIDVSNVKLGIKYTLTKSALYNVIEKQSKMYFEITDGIQSYGTSVEIEPETDEGLKVGDELEIEVPIAGSQLGNIINNGYKINVYEEVDGFKRLLGSKKYGSFQVIGN